LVSFGGSIDPRRRWRLRLDDLDVNMCPREAPLCLNLPEAVLRKRFATAFFVFIFGINFSLSLKTFFLSGTFPNVQQYFQIFMIIQMWVRI